MKARIAAEQCRENRGVCEQDIPRTVAAWRHPEDHVEFAVAGFGEVSRTTQGQTTVNIASERSCARVVFRGENLF
jgi:hypothetical protein